MDVGGPGPEGQLATVTHRTDESSGEDKFYLVASERLRDPGQRGDEADPSFSESSSIRSGRFWLKLPKSGSSSSSEASPQKQQKQQVAAFRLRDGDVVKCGRSGPVLRVRLCKVPNLPASNARFSSAKDIAAGLDPNFASAEEMQVWTDCCEKRCCSCCCCGCGELLASRVVTACT